MIQGEIRWHTFKEPDKRRPVLILTNNELISDLTQITVAQITTTIRSNDSEVLLDEGDGMIELCVVNLTNIYTIQKDKIGSFITYLPPAKMAEVFEAIKFVFSFN